MKVIIKAIMILSLVAVILPLTSCEETYGNCEPISWRIVSVSDDNAIKATVNKAVANVTCGPSGGVVLLKASALNMVMYTESIENLEMDEYGRGISYRNDWCEITRELAEDGTVFRICFSEYKPEKDIEFHLDLSDYQGGFGYGDIYLRRIP